MQAVSGHPARRQAGDPRAATVAVVGAGLAGLAAALALAVSGVRVSLVGERPSEAALGRETRSTALFGGSIELLRHIGAWQRLAAEMAPLRALRLIDDTGSLLRAPEVLFEAAEIGRDAFGVNIENRNLLTVLWCLAEAHADIACVRGQAQSLTLSADRAEIVLQDGRRLEAQLVIGADGEASMCRQAAGIGVRAWSYPQAALATRFQHQRPHGDTSIELHRRAGPLTTVPLPGLASSLVWVERPEAAERLAGLAPEAFAHELEQRLGGLLGTISNLGSRRVFPLSGSAAHTLAERRVALVGEAAHRLPPIGAQGLNLGLRDVAWLADIVVDELARGGDAGGPAALAAYCRARQADVASRGLAVDLLNRSLLAGLLPIDAIRGAGLLAMRHWPGLRQLAMREGVAPAGPLPRLMQPSHENGFCVSGTA